MYKYNAFNKYMSSSIEISLEIYKTEGIVYKFIIENNKNTHIPFPGFLYTKRSFRLADSLI